MSASIQKVNLEHNQDIDVVQNIMSQEPTQKLDFEELGHIVHLLHSDNEIMQAQHIRSLIEIICKELRQGFFNEIIDFIDNEGLIDILLTHTIRDVLLHIVDVIPRYGPSQIDEKESIELQQTYEQEGNSNKYNMKTQRNSQSMNKSPQTLKQNSIQNTKPSMKAKKISQMQLDALINTSTSQEPESDPEKEQIDTQMRVKIKSPTFIQKEQDIQLQGKQLNIHKNKKINQIINEISPIKVNNIKQLNKDELQLVDKDIDDQILQQIYQSPPDADDVLFDQQNVSQQFLFDNQYEFIQQMKNINQLNFNNNNNEQKSFAEKDCKYLIGQQQEKENKQKQEQNSQDKTKRKTISFIQKEEQELRLSNNQFNNKIKSNIPIRNSVTKNSKDINIRGANNYKIKVENPNLQFQSSQISKQQFFDQSNKINNSNINIVSNLNSTKDKNDNNKNSQNSINSIESNSTVQSNSIHSSNKQGSSFKTSNSGSVSTTSSIKSTSSITSTRSSSNNNQSSNNNIKIIPNPAVPPRRTVVQRVFKLKNQGNPLITSPLKQSYIPDSPSVTPSLQSTLSFRSLSQISNISTMSIQSIQLAFRSPRSQTHSPLLSSSPSQSLDMGNNNIMQQQQQKLQQVSKQYNLQNIDEQDYQLGDTCSSSLLINSNIAQSVVYPLQPSQFSEQSQPTVLSQSSSSSPQIFSSSPQIFSSFFSSSSTSQLSSQSELQSSKSQYEKCLLQQQQEQQQQEYQQYQYQILKSQQSSSSSSSFQQQSSEQQPLKKKTQRKTINNISDQN